VRRSFHPRLPSSTSRFVASTMSVNNMVASTRSLHQHFIGRREGSNPGSNMHCDPTELFADQLTLARANVNAERLQLPFRTEPHAQDQGRHEAIAAAGSKDFPCRSGDPTDS
jgi:hypothetical protein